MMKVDIHGGVFAGNAGELVEAGETTSKVRVLMFGRETVVDVSNENYTADGEAFDVFGSFLKDITTDRRWEAREALQDWWLAQGSAATWAEHLQRQATADARAEQEAAGLLRALKDGVQKDAGPAEVERYFREHESTFRPYRVLRRERHEQASESEREREVLLAASARSLQRVAFRAWWAVQPRPTESCRDFLESAWSGDDYSAMADAEFEAFERWGREAVELTFNRWRDDPIAVRELAALPADHTWRRFIGVDPGEAVRDNFGPIAHHAPAWLDAFASAVRVLYTLKIDGKHHLVYACDSNEGYGAKNRPVLSVLVGGPALDPAQLDSLDEQLSDYVRAKGWQVPPELRELYAIHHGLGRIASWGASYDNAGSVYPAGQLSVLGDMMNAIAEEQDFHPQGYRFDDLLTYFEDGAGNGQNFLRRDTDVVGTVDWDHETRDVGQLISFWDFLQHSPQRWWFGES